MALGRVAAVTCRCLLPPQLLVRLFGGLPAPMPSLGSPGCRKGQQGVVSSPGPSTKRDLV